MKNAPLLVACSLVAGAAGGALAIVFRPEQRVQADDGPAAADELAGLRTEVQALRAAREEISRRLSELESRASMSVPASRAEVDPDAEQLESWLRENAGLLRELVAAVPDPLAAADAVTERDLLEALDVLIDPSIDDVTKQELWKELAEKGASDDLVAMFEERAQRDPNDPDVHVDLAYAYLQKIFEVGNSPAAGMWAVKADEAYDAALALDSNHWEARFSKAISLSFWPPIMGKQKEAISQFETLIEVQQKLPHDPDHAQTFALLGNLHQQAGNTAEALKIWQQGLAAFPEDEDLQAKVAAAQGGG